MSEPTSQLKFEDLILRVAEEAGITGYGSSGDERAMIPIDEFNLDQCKRAVNDGIRRFIADSPTTGWRWTRRIMSVTMTATRITGTIDSVSGSAPGSYTFVDATLSSTYDTNDDLNGYWVYILTGTGIGLYAQITDYVAATGTCTVADWLDVQGNVIAYTGGAVPVANDTFAITPVETVAGNLHRYPLSEYFNGEVDGEIHYSSDTNHGTHIEWVHESYIRNRRSVSVITGYPRRAAIRHLEPSAGVLTSKRRFELVVDPKPVAADTLEFPYTVSFDELRLIAGESSSGSTVTLVDSTFAGLYPDDYFNGWTIKILSGAGKTSYAIVTDFNGSDCTFTVADWLFLDGTAGGVDAGSNSIYQITPAANLHPAGLRFDEVIKAACLAQAERDIENVTGGYGEDYEKALQKAYSIDVRSAPRKLGTMNYGQRHLRERTWTDVNYS